jgi:nucleoside-diphosphate-sugar epimerase
MEYRHRSDGYGCGDADESTDGHGEADVLRQVGAITTRADGARSTGPTATVHFAAQVRVTAAMDATRTTGATINMTVRPYRFARGNPCSGNNI